MLADEYLFMLLDLEDVLMVGVYLDDEDDDGDDDDVEADCLL